MKNPKTHRLWSIINCLDKVINPLIKIATVIACTAVTLMMVLTFFNVTGRMAFDLPIKGYYEMIELFMLLMTVFAIGYTASLKGHIRVDILSNFISSRANRVLDIIANSVAFVFFVLVAWRGCVNGLTNFNGHLTTGVVHIPIYPFNFTLAIGAALLALVFFRDSLKAIYEVNR